MPILDPKIPVAARSIDALQRHVGRVQAITGTRNNNALLVNPGDARRQVWVRPTYADYRDAWIRVFTYIADPANMDVDHIYNKARAQVVGYDYVRLFLVEKGVNRNHGRVERLLVRVSLAPGRLTRDPDIAYATNWNIAKISGNRVGRENVRYDQAAALDWLVSENFM
ncbi:hypothetical protein [Polyangium sorediatum]|uniref:HNH nuclease domain-containing protein n=1 Tax=Polyangium sorediatum TaxID=889274 RepID=A0ABT6PAQ1_9BACT|nr:hypothetical protein [Polyangium sorediatum]MDI1437714.1 hypothetical protein [Polyangium sorediatum]